MLETTLAGQPATESPGVARAGRPDAGISVSELRSKKVAVDWAEATAIVQALCQAICGPTGHPQSARVGPDNVFIHADGTVTVAASSQRTGVTLLQQLGDVLRQILNEEHVRQPLRGALFHPAAGSSVELWSKRLEYYERQNRSLHIQAVYERAVNAAVRMTAAESAERPWWFGSAPGFAAANQLREGKRRFLSTRRVLAGLAIGLVAAGGAAVLWMADNALGGEPSSYENEATPVNARRRAPQPQPASRATRNAQAMETDFQADPIAAPTSDVPVPAAMDDISAIQRSQVIYSEADAGVVPAMPMDPRLPSTIPVGMSSDNFAEFELLITEGGGVESVKALRVPATMTDAVSMTMRLSAAKAWRFHPALKDGEPVRYRRIVWVLKS